MIQDKNMGLRQWPACTTWLPVTLSETGIKRIPDTLAKQIIAENSN
jgi:hypothetical protein